MTQQDVLDYIRKTPHNSNVNVMKSMLDSLGGSSLPEVTNEDNGKVLTVVEGEWDKAAGGGAEPLIVRVDHSEGMVSYFDKTWQEVYDAAKAGSVVVAIDKYDAVFSFGTAQISPIDGHLVVFGSTDYKMDTVADSADGYLHTKAVG